MATSGPDTTEATLHLTDKMTLGSMTISMILVTKTKEVPEKAMTLAAARTVIGTNRQTLAKAIIDSKKPSNNLKLKRRRYRG